MTSHLETAIRDAVEKGGYEGMGAKAGVQWIIEHRVPHILLDPAFWRALGKARGWDGQISYWGCRNCDDGACWMEPWSYYWHRLIDHLASGGTIESFFTNLT